jgi:hypothetical protein
MTRYMYRYELPIDDQPHTYALGSWPLAAAPCGDPYKVEFWAEHDDNPDNVRPIEVTLQVFGTGHPLPEWANWIATLPRTDLGLVWHIYVVGDNDY